MKLEYEFPQGFYADAKDLVSQLLVIEPTERLGCESKGGYEVLKTHEFFEGIEWETLVDQTPPTMIPFLPAKDSDSESGQYSSQVRPYLTLPSNCFLSLSSLLTSIDFLVQPFFTKKQRIST